MNITVDELKNNGNGQYEDGYRIVLFDKNGNYYIDAYSGTIEGFMIGFSENDPIIDEDDIPKFISIDDLLGRYLNALPNMVEVALYKTDGTCIEKKSRTKVK